MLARADVTEDDLADALTARVSHVLGAPDSTQKRIDGATAATVLQSSHDGQSGLLLQRRSLITGEYLL